MASSFGLTSSSDRFSPTRQAETLQRKGAKSKGKKEKVKHLAGQNREEDVLLIVNSLVQPERLSNVQTLVLRQSWSGLTYEEIAAESGYSSQHIRDVGCRLWQLLSKASGKRVRKSNLHSVIGQLLSEIG